MARIFVTGSADGLGQLAAQSLIQQGHTVVLHARNKKRGDDAINLNPNAEKVLIADLSSVKETIKLAQDINDLGVFDAVIHNAGLYTGSSKDIVAVNVLAPYILTSLINKPKRLIYLSSGMHMSGHAKLDDLENDMNCINYSDSKLLILMLCLATTRLWKDVYSNTVNPGWVPTKMGGRSAPDNLQKGYETQVWLATSNDGKAKVSGRYFFHQQETRFNSEAGDISLQQRFLSACKSLTGISFPDSKLV